MTISVTYPTDAICGDSSTYVEEFSPDLSTYAFMDYTGSITSFTLSASTDDNDDANGDQVETYSLTFSVTHPTLADSTSSISLTVEVAPCVITSFEPDITFSDDIDLVIGDTENTYSYAMAIF